MPKDPELTEEQLNEVAGGVGGNLRATPSRAIPPDPVKIGFQAPPEPDKIFLTEPPEPDKFGP